MKFNKVPFISLLLLCFATGVFAQDLKNLIPKDVYCIGTVDLNKIKSKEGFQELANLPLMVEFSDKIAKSIFKDTSANQTLGFADLNTYGVDPSGKAYIYVSGNEKIMYGALLVNLNNESLFTSRVKTIVGDNPDWTIVENNNTKSIQTRELKVIWNNKVAAIWMATIAPAFNDSIRRSLDAKYQAENVFPGQEDRVEEETALEEAPVEVVPQEEVEAISEESAEETVVEPSSDDVAVVEEMEENTPVVEADTPEEESVAIEDALEYDAVDTVEEASEGEYEDNSGDEVTYDNQYDSYFAAQVVCDSILRDWCNSNAELFLQDKGVNSLAFNTEYNNFVKKNPDAALMLDYGRFTGLYAGAMGLRGLAPAEYAILMTSIMNLYSGMKLYATIDHNKDDVTASMEVKFSDAMARIYKDVKKKKISSKFLPYMDKNAMGYLAFGADIEGISKGVHTYLRELLPNIPQYGDIAVSAMDLIDIVVDEKRLYNIFTGDVVVTFNGMRPMPIIHTMYDFDDNFNKIEKTDTSIQVKPDALIMLGVGNKEDVTKIFDILIKSKLLKQIGSYYSLADNGMDFPVYFRIENDILFITNNVGFIQKPVAYASNQRMGKEHKKLFRKNTAVVYADMSNIFTYLSQEGPSSYKNSFAEAANNFSKVTFSANMRKKNSSSSSYIFKLKESNENALVDILRFVNFIYVDKTRERYE
jgi:hypothetical protein